MSNIVTPQAPTRPSSKEEPAPMVVASPARRRPMSRDRLTAILRVTPSIIAIALFIYAFIAWNGWASLTNWRGIGVLKLGGPIKFPAADFIGLHTSERLFNDPRFVCDPVNPPRHTIISYDWS